MRIAIDGRSLAVCKVPRGWDRYTLAVARELAAAGHDVVFIHRRGSVVEDSLLSRSGLAALAPADHGGIHWEQIALPAALARWNADVYLATIEHGVPLWAPCPVVLTLHSVTPHSYRDLVASGTLPPPLRAYLGYDFRTSTWRYAYWRSQVQRAAHLIAPSAYCRDEIVRLLGVSGERVTVAPLALADEFRAPRASEDVRADALRRHGVRLPYVLYVGGYEPHKNVRGAIRAFALTRRGAPSLQLVLVGTGSVSDAIVEFARQQHLEGDGNIRFLSDIASDLPALYDEAAAFISLSWRESFGLPALEAAVRGTPVVVSGWGAAREVLGDAAMFVDPRDVEAAAAALLRGIGVPAHRRALSPAVSARFSWKQTAAAMLDVCNRVTVRTRSMAARRAVSEQAP